MAINKNNKRVAVKCKICGKMCKDIDFLVSHIDKDHYDQIFPDFSASQYEYYLRTGKKVGKCVVCGGESGWNKTTNKYHRMCSDTCRDEYREIFKKRMIGKHGKVHLLDDPEQQRKMIYAKKTSGRYIWEMDNGEEKEIPYASSYEKDFLEMLDTFLNHDGNDIIGPSPHNYTYTYGGTTHIYIPDYYIPSLNLEIEIKDGGTTGAGANKHPKIQAVDKVKEKLKDEVMESNSKSINYIKVVNKEYGDFFRTLLYLRSTNTCEATPKQSKSSTPVTESVIDNLIEVDNIAQTIVNKEDFALLKQTLLKRAKTAHPAHLKDIKELLDAWVDKCNSIKNLKENHRDYYLVVDAVNLSDYIENVIRPELERRAMYLDVVLESHKIDVFTNVMDDGKEMVMRPVYILLTYTDSTLAKLIKMKTGEPYSHASISMDTELDKMYTFGRKNIGDKLKFIEEDIHSGALKSVEDTASYSLYMVLLTDKEYTNVQSTLDKFKSKADSLKYNFSGLISLAFGKGSESENKYFCSEFIAEVLRCTDDKMYSKMSNLMTPMDLVKGKRFKFIRKGTLKNYNRFEVDRKVKEIISQRGFD